MEQRYVEVNSAFANVRKAWYGLHNEKSDLLEGCGFYCSVRQATSQTLKTSIYLREGQCSLKSYKVSLTYSSSMRQTKRGVNTDDIDSTLNELVNHWWKGSIFLYLERLKDARQSDWKNIFEIQTDRSISLNWIRWKTTSSFHGKVYKPTLFHGFR